MPQLRLILILALLTFFLDAANACQSCLLDLLGRSSIQKLSSESSNTNHYVKNQIHASAFPITISSIKTLPIAPSLNNAGMDSSVLSFLVVRKFIALHNQNKDNMHRAQDAKTAGIGLKLKRIMYSDSDSDAEESKAEKEDMKAEVEEEEIMSSSMIMAIGFYKQFISPLLPPACRFLPTCSQYGVQAIKEFGPTKGVVLTAWRLARCSPLGGKGYDPPKWPPVSYTYGSY